MPISLQPSHKAELRVEVGKTTVEELQKFQQEVAKKGGGEIRAKKNPDGSHTLYVAANKKVRLSSIFGETWGAEARAGKVSLAKDLVKEIIMRRLPSGDGTGPAAETAKNLLSRIDQRNTSTELGKVLEDVSKTVYEGLSQKTKDHYGQLDVIMSTPGLREAFGRNMTARHCSENFEFLCLEREFSKAQNPHEKLALAEKMFKMIESEENPSSVSIENARQGQINIDAPTSEKIFEEIQHLRESIVPGKEPSETDKARLNNLFSEATTEVRDLVTNNNLSNFTGSDAFKVEVSKIHARTVFSENDANPASYLAPGSGEEFAQRQTHFSSLENILADPEIRTAFKDHLKGGKQEGNFERYEQVENLAKLAQSGDISDGELLRLSEELFLGGVPENGGDDPHVDFVRDQLKSLREEHELLGGTPESRLEQDKLFGTDDSKENLIRDKIKGFLEMMKADVANGLRGDGFKSFQGAKLDRLIGERMFNEQLDWQAGSERHFGSWERFSGKELVGSGGATGSGRAKVGKQLFQVKGSISHAGLGRRLKAGGLNTENYGEVIASNIARAMVGARDRHMIPEVALRQDGSNHEAMVTSKYLSGGKGDLKDLYKELAGPLPKGQKHPKIHLGSPPGARSGDGILRLSGQSSQDVQRNIALSALLGDHDVNPGNMIALKDGHVGRIDFGHAFNELINGPGGTSTGGGGVRNKENRILDFFNRETVSGNPLVRGQNKAKLWRDYVGAGPSEGMTQALREIASSTEALDGILQAKTQFSDLIASLEAEGTPEAKKQIRDLTRSLARISKNLEKPITSTDPGAIVQEVFQNLETFIREGQQQMRDVADLSELQTKIDAYVNGTRDNPDAPVPEDIQQAYQALLEKSVKTTDGSGLVWMKMTDQEPAFQGSLGAYIQSRRTELSGV